MAQTLFFSEYAEGSSNNKYLEIYNPTNRAISLDEYAFPNASNGAEGNYEFWNTFPAGATIQAGGTYLIAHPDADASILALADQTHPYLSNGDDGYALVKGTESDYVIIDRIGDFGADPGSGWDVAGISNATQNHTLVRKSSVFSGNADWDASRGTNTTDSEWVVLDNDAFLKANPQATPGSFSTTAETPIVLPSESSEEEPVITTNTFISTIQGSGIASELVGEQHRIEGIVTAIHPAMKGFYVQEEAADSDNDASTSEGLFIYDPSGLFNGAIGDLIQVTGTVSEYTTNAANFTSSSNEVQNSLTQLSSITDVSILSSGNSLPAISELTLPVADIAAMEALEGMRVSVNAGQNPLTVTNNYTTGRFGQVGLSAQGRLYQYTEQNAPDVDGYSAYLSELGKAVIWLDDASTAGNPATVIHARGGEPLSASNTLRTGDTIESISGVLDQRFEGYRVQSTEPADFQPANERSLTAPARQGSVRVAAFNLLNFWNGDGAGSGFPTERGALSLEQYDQQLTKLLAALQGLNADIVALQELENDGFGPTSAIASLVDALNGEAGANVYDYVRVPDAALTEGRLGTDAIANGLIYRTDKVRLATDTEIASLDLGYTRVGDDPATQSANRPVIAASFEDLSSGETFTTVSAHLKSKGSEAQGEGNADINDGQGLSNGQRSREAQAIADWLKTDPTGSGDPDVLILGDFNAYSMEDPLTLLKAEGYSDLATAGNYTYQFRGQFGALDHAMASDNFLSSVVNASPWHINSDEPVALVHTNYRYSPDLTVGSDSIEPYYAPDAYASSDHDPIVVDLFATGSELFSHGVASGDPYADSVILWTRYTAEALPFASLTSKEIAWEVSSTKDFATLVDSGTFTTSAERDWTVKVEADGLEAGTAYYYRFNADGVYSEIGETNTLSVDANQVRLAVLSCANFTNTPAFDTYSRVASIDAKRPFDAALFLGDYIYEYGEGGYAAAESAANQRGFSPDKEIITLEDYRQRYGQYHTDAGLREMRASLPLIAIWDDHETANDSFKTGAENHDPDQGEGDWSDRVNAAMQAYYEWMPIREPEQREGTDAGTAETPLSQGYRSFDFSDVLSLHVLETRLTARDEQLAYPGAAELSARIGEIITSPQLIAAYATALGQSIDTDDAAAVASFAQSDALIGLVTLELVGAVVTEALTDPTRKMIGDQQLTWLSNEMATSNASWQVLGQQVLMQSMAIPAELLLQANDPTVLAKYATPLAKLAAGVALTNEELALFDEASKIPYNLDAWDGYGAEREAILQTAAALGKSLVSLAGDTHNAWAGVLDVMSSTNAASAGDVVGLEFATPGVSSPGLESYFGPGLEPLFTAYVDGLDYAELSRRGFLDITFTHDDVTADFQFQNPNSFWTNDVLISTRQNLAIQPAEFTTEANTFRINPYLQNPTSEGMSVTWFTHRDGVASITLTGPGIAGERLIESNVTEEPLLSYTSAELRQTISGLDESWLISGGNFKHVVDLEGLESRATYNYTVTLNGGETFQSSFETAPDSDDWDHIRFIAMSDSETEPKGRVDAVDWQPSPLQKGSLARPSLDDSQWAEVIGTRSGSLRYALNQRDGYKANLDIVNEREPDFLIMPGDLVQGGGYQPGWDEFFRHNAGDFSSGLSSYPLLPALGNWENYGALNGAYGEDEEGRFGPMFGRQKYHVYFDAPENGTPEHRDNYYRVDYGPVTILTLDSSNGEPDDSRNNYGGEGQPGKATGLELTDVGTDTQDNYTREQYESYGGTDLSDFNPGSIQWNWVEEQLRDARDRGQIIFAQFHHAPYSSGVHGFPMNHDQSSGQAGTPLRQYSEMFEDYGVAAVFSGHSEMFERSFVDGDGDGNGVNFYDVGIAGDGLRGQHRTVSRDFDSPLFGYNSEFSKWTADQNEPELWQLVDGVPQLMDGGKHYGHLEVNIKPVVDILGVKAMVELSPVYSFPILDSNYELIETERRIYGDQLVMWIADDGAVANTLAGFYREPLRGTSGDDDTLLDEFGFKGVSDTIFLGSGDDIADSEIAGGQKNTIFMGSGDDTAFANAHDVITGGTGNDTLNALSELGGNRLSGNTGFDVFNVSGSHNRILGGANDDIINVLDGAGTNYLNGGHGTDQFWLISAAGDRPAAKQYIMDWTVGEDVIGLAGVNFSDLSFQQVGADTLLSIGNDPLGHFKNTNAATLNNIDNFAGLA